MKYYLFSALILLSFYSCSSDGSTEMMVEQSNDTTTDDSNDNSDNTDNNNYSYQGDFISSAHETRGVATVNVDKTKLTLTNFKTDDGPLLELYLATDTTAKTYVSLGVLKGIDGNFEYDLPENIDFVEYSHVIVWCVDFSVNFGYAVLK